jgi:hypothetical protein
VHPRPKCLDRRPTQDNRPREARQVPPAIASPTAEPEATATVPWAAALGARTAGAEDEEVSAYVPEQGDGAALVLDEQVDPHVD